MATAKRPANAFAARKTAAKAPRAVSKLATAGSEIRPMQDSFTKAALAAHVAEQASVGPRVAKALLAALEQTVLGALHKQGADLPAPASVRCWQTDLDVVGLHVAYSNNGAESNDWRRRSCSASN